jgi:guanylate kinase
MSPNAFSKTEDLKTAIEIFSKTYTPSQEVAEHIRPITAVPIIGPFCVGKTTLIGEVETKNPDFGHSQSFTDRHIRPGEDPDTYRWLARDRITYNEILNDMYEGKFVQIAVHPSSKTIYGSSVEDYQAPFTMLDTLSKAMDDIYRTGFGDVKPVGLVTPHNDWEPRLALRAKQISDQEFKDRLKEAGQSLIWLLDQGPDFPWLVNADGRLSQTADKLVRVVKEADQTDRNNRKVGEGLLEYLKSR